VAAEVDSTGRHPSELPISLRAAIDLISIGFRSPDGRVHGRVIGHPRLVEELRHSVPMSEGDRCLFALGAESVGVSTAIERTTPSRVVTLDDGRLGRIVRRARSDATPPMPEIPAREWRALGYATVSTFGVQGLGSLAWAAAERVLRRVKRPDLADRCRVGMLRTLRTARVVPDLALVVVRVFQRAE
jgi:hypothetical protein